MLLIALFLLIGILFKPICINLYFSDCFAFVSFFRKLLKATLRDILNNQCTITGLTMCQEYTVVSWKLM